MAIPTITSITPATGPSTGMNLVEIVGTGFKLPVIVAGLPAPAAVPTVQVLFGGIASARVKVISDTLVRCEVPPYAAGAMVLEPAAVNVTLTNLLLDGTPVLPLERVTVSDGYTYARWELAYSNTSEPPTMLKVLKTLIARFRREVIPTFATSTHVEYTEAGGTYTKLAEIPGVAVASFGIPVDKEYSDEDNERYLKDNGNNTWSEFKGTITRMLVLNLLVAGGSDAGPLGDSMFVLERLLEAIEMRPYLDVEGDLHPGETHSYEIQVTQDPRTAKGVTNAGVMTHSMQLTVRGIRCVPQSSVDLLYRAMTGYLTMSNLDGDNPETVQMAPISS